LSRTGSAKRKSVDGSADRERKILGLLLLSLGLLVALGLVQHRVGGVDDSRVFNEYVSRGLIHALGLAAWLVPILLVRTGWNRVAGGSVRRLGKQIAFAAAVLITFALLVYSTRLFSEERSFFLGGAFGQGIFGAMDHYFGAIGSTLIGVTFLLVVMTALYDISVPRVTLPALPGPPDRVRRVPADAGAWIGRLGRRVLEAGGPWLRGLTNRIHAWRERWEAERGAEEAALIEEAVATESPVVVAEPTTSQEPEPSTPLGEGDPEGGEDETAQNEAVEETPEGDAIEIFAPASVETTNGAVPKKRRGKRGEKEYLFPPITLLSDPPDDAPTVPEEYLREQSTRLEEALTHFGVRAKVTEIHPGPVITRFELEPAPGVKVQQIAGLADDLALALRAKRIRIVAPIPGKGAVGIEIPNPETRTVYLKEVLTSTAFAERTSTLTVALGKDISGAPLCTSLEGMPHLLLAGATGSGKSVSLHTILTSLIYGAAPEEIHLILIDPKMLEMTVYNGIPHLLTPVVTDAKEAARVLRWGVFEMERRYKLLARVGVRNILDYNRQLPRLQASRDIQEEGIKLDPLPYLVIVIDEFADLILTAPNEIEDSVARLAQMARAVGIHLVLATQRPSVNVITGVIKANFPSRIAFQVASKIDSRTIIDANGAEKLLGKGDMLFVFSGRPEVHRVHGAFISTDETTEIVTFLKEQGYQPKDRRTVLLEDEAGGSGGGGDMDHEDELFDEAARIVIHAEQGSVSLLQRRLRVGYSRAGRLLDLLEDAGIVGPFEGSKAREVLVGEEWLRTREQQKGAPAGGDG